MRTQLGEVMTPSLASIPVPRVALPELTFLACPRASNPWRTRVGARIWHRECSKEAMINGTWQDGQCPRVASGIVRLFPLLLHMADRDLPGPSTVVG
jgi:hypothetical protein